MFRRNKVNKKAIRRSKLKRSLQMENLEERRVLTSGVVLEFDDPDPNQVGFLDRINDIGIQWNMGHSAFTSLDAAEIEAAVVDKVNEIYADFSIVFEQAGIPNSQISFLEGTVSYYKSDDSGGLSEIEGSRDIGNNFGNASIDLFVGNYGVLDHRAVLSESPTRQEAVRVLSRLFANETAHAVGHILGLQEYDSYGTIEIGPSYFNGGSTNPLTDSQQNQHVGFPLLGDQGIETLAQQGLTLSPFAKAKLQFADRIGVGSRTTWFESSYFNDDFANALEFTLPEDPSSVSGQRTIKVLGGLSSGSDRDVYEFSAVAGQQLTVNAISRRVDSDDIGIDPNLSIYDSNGNLIGLSQDIWGGENSFGGGSADEGFISNDAMITNFEFTETGTYFIAVDGASSDSGVYELFVSVENVFNPYHNHGVGVDVNGDGRISPLDALLVMNTLSDFLSPGTVATISAASVPTVKYDVDVNGDTGVSPFDALEVIDYLAAAIADARNGGQGEGPGVISLKDFEVVDFRVFPDLEDGRFLEFETANTGVLTLETPNATGLVEIHRIATDGSQLPTAYLDASNGRIDIDVNAGEIVTVFSEDELPEGVRVTNLVSLSPNGKTVYVAGTEDRDSFTVDASTSNYLLDVKGTSYSYDGNHVTRVFVDGGGERDTIDVYTSSDYDAAYLREDSANIYGDGGYSIFATTIENKTVYSNGGDDFARFFDSAGDDRYVAHPDSARLSLAGVYFSEVQDFAHADARATSGGADYAFFYDSAGNDQYRATPVYAYMTGDGYYNYANGFERNYGFAESGGNDTAFLIASSGADHYFGRNDMGFLEGEDYYNYQRGFDTVHLNGLAGGLNTLDEDDLDYVLNLQGNWI